MKKIFIGIVCGVIASWMLAGCSLFSDPEKNDTPVVQVSLPEAVWKGNLDQVKKCLGRGADVAKSDRRGRTPLHLAVMRENLEITRCLLEHGADVNCQDDEGRTPLHIAFQVKKKDISDLLIERGAERTIQDVYGRIPGDLTPVPMEKKMARRKQLRQERKARSGKRKKIRWKNN